MPEFVINNPQRSILNLNIGKEEDRKQKEQGRDRVMVCRCHGDQQDENDRGQNPYRAAKPASLPWFAHRRQYSYCAAAIPGF
jgi:Rieske Fe-S protein